MIRRVNMSYDDEKHPTVHLGLANHQEPSDSAYMRKCIEFYELNRGDTINQHLILERLARIETMLKSGVVLANGGQEPPTGNDPTDEIFDEALDQLE